MDPIHFPYARRSVAVLALSMAAVCSAQPASPSATSSKPATAPAAKTTPPIKSKQASAPKLLTREELRACMAQETRLKGLREDLTRQHAALDKDQADIQRETQALKQALETLDRTSEPAVQAHQARAAANDQLIDGYNAKVPAFNAAGTALHDEEVSYAKNCAGRSFEEGDELAIKRAKK